MLFSFSVGNIIAVADTYPNIRIPVTTSPPPLNGNANDPRWLVGVAAIINHDIIYKTIKTSEPTTTRLLVDNKYFYVGFTAEQTSAITDTQVTNDSGNLSSDDVVGIVLWPTGQSGFQYSFQSNPSGVHDQFSSENDAFQPKWTSVGKRIPGGFSVTMRIPLNVMKRDGRDVWKIQLYRFISRTGQLFVWSYDPNETNVTNPKYAGKLTGMASVGTAATTKIRPRVEVYALGIAQPGSSGGSALRTGIDYSIPITKTTSMFGTFHPDYSNVESDQQSISPSEFSRKYSEVRPFFTQAQSFYNMSGFADLYTPSIPTPIQGYAYEGTQGLFESAGFDAIGNNRNDNAQMFAYNTPNQALTLGLQRVQSTTATAIDATTTGSAYWSNQKNLSVYGSLGVDIGPNNPRGGLNQNKNFGITYFGPKKYFTLNYISTGLFYNPVDGYVAHPDTAGLNYSLHREFDYTPTSKIVSFSLDAYLDSYKDHTGTINQTDSYGTITINTRHRVSLSWSAGANYLSQYNTTLLPFTQNGPSLTFAANPALPTDIGFRSGHYFDGFLTSVYFDSTLPLWKASNTFTINYYATNYRSPTVPNARQILLRLAANVQYSREGSFSIGWRTITGSPPQATYQLPQHYGNFSLALMQRVHAGQFYLAYGDPNTLNTTPSVILKFIDYLSGEKGT